MSNYQFRGIVAVGNTRAQAVNRYRLVAANKGVTCFVDPNNKLAFVSNSGADLENTFNPLNGNIDLDKSNEVLNDLQFQAKAGDVHHAYHHQCTAGCGLHIVFDEPSFVQHCPSCATALSADVEDDEDDATDDLSDQELDDLEVEDEELDDEEIDDSEDDAEEDEDDSTAVASDGDDGDEDSDSDDDSDEEESDDSDEEIDDSEDEESDDDADSDSDDEDESDDNEEDDMSDAPLVVAASSYDEAVQVFRDNVTKGKAFSATAGDGASAAVTAEYRVCASAEGCGSHVISQVELDNCPRAACGKPLTDPETVTASEDNGDDAGSDDNAKITLIDVSEKEGRGENADDGEDDSADSDSDEGDEEQSSDNEDQDSGADTNDSSTEASMSLNKSQSNDGGSDDDDEEDEEADEVEIDMLDDLDDDVTEEDLDVSYSAAVAGSPAWTAYVRGTPVAMATQTSISAANRELFGTPRFGQVAHAASKIAGVKQTLSELGFKGIKASLSVSKHVESRVAALAAAREEELAQRENENMERMQAALATAAVGITRGFFAGQVNPVREQLNSALAGVGIRNPGLIVDNAMQASFETFLRSVFDKGRDILSKPAEVQESLARSVIETAYMPKSFEATAGSGGEHPLDTRLATFGTVVASDKADRSAASKTESAVATAAAASDDGFNAKLQAAIGGLGRHR